MCKYKMSKSRYVIGIDIGTTSIRCHIINSKAKCVAASSKTMNLIYPQPGYVEINPEELWNGMCYVLKSAICDANIKSSQIASLGICTQRATFTTWRKDNGEPFHNFITWKDLRADSLVQYWNSNFVMKAFQMTCYGLYLITRNPRYLTGSCIKLTNTETTLRLVWVINNVPELKPAIRNKNALFGTVDSWLIYKLTSGRQHVTDFTNASATGLFDPFVLQWTSWTKTILKIPSEIFPTIVNNDHNFGSIKIDSLEISIPIACIISDQSASMFGSCCFNSGDIKLTLGTGTFLDVNTDQKVYGSTSGLYPLVGWKLNNEIKYLIEGSCNDTGSVIQWALQAGVIENVRDSSAVANEVENTDGVYFIPAFSGLGPPITDDHAASGFIGLKVTSTRQHMVRAILESIVYRITLLYNMAMKEIDYKIKSICIDGGVSNNDFICQLLANVLGVKVERPSSSEMSMMGLAFIVGLKTGIWNDKKELKKLRTLNQVFKPSCDTLVNEKCLKEFHMWLKAVDRFKAWYNS